MRRWLLVVLLLCCACTSSEKERPNIVFVLVDDMNTRLLPYLPRLKRMMPDQGLSLVMNVPTPVCAPSRATILSGKYGHNTGVKTNGVWSGGIWAWRAGHNEENTVAVWLQAAGYQTGAFGKYLNGYDGPIATVPPGWDRWVSYKKTTFTRRDFQSIETGEVTRDIKNQYDTEFFAEEAAKWVATAREPFFAIWTPMAPHGPFVPPPRYKDRFSRLKIDWPPSFSADPAEVEKLTRTRLEMMLGVEDGVAALIDAIEKRGALERTYIVFTSDHGLFMGEHGFAAGKGEAYDETTRVPLYVRGPGVPIGESDALVASPDLAPTFAAIAGATVPPDVDGHSILPLWRGKDLAQPRKRFLLEWFDPYGKVLWQGLRMPQEKLVRYADGKCVRFDLAADPYEMSGADCGAAAAAQASGFIDRLAACKGPDCSAAETE